MVTHREDQLDVRERQHRRVLCPQREQYSESSSFLESAGIPSCKRPSTVGTTFSTLTLLRLLVVVDIGRSQFEQRDGSGSADIMT